MAWNEETVGRALDLIESGASDRAAGRATQVPHETVRTWRGGRVPRQVALKRAGIPVCSAGGEPAHDEGQVANDHYAYLLGIYLGDGWLGAGAGSVSLRIAMDERYPGIIGLCCDAIELVRGRPPSVQSRKTDCVEIVSYWKQWPCLFPQHGPGRKHHRPIVLSDWQREIVAERPEPLLRGLIHSDGWRGLNKVTVKGRDYAYPRYQFSNRSQDIKAIFTDARESIGVEWRPWGRWHVSVAKRDSVARLDRFIGPKC